MRKPEAERKDKALSMRVSSSTYNKVMEMCVKQHKSIREVVENLIINATDEELQGLVGFDWDINGAQIKKTEDQEISIAMFCESVDMINFNFVGRCLYSSGWGKTNPTCFIDEFNIQPEGVEAYTRHSLFIDAESGNRMVLQELFARTERDHTLVNVARMKLLKNIKDLSCPEIEQYMNAVDIVRVQRDLCPEIKSIDELDLFWPKKKLG